MAMKRQFFLKTFKFYPRPNHFKRRLDNLFPRFNNVVGAFPHAFHDNNSRKEIDYAVKVLTKPLNITVICNADVDLKKLVIVDLGDYTRHTTVDIEAAFSSDRGLSVFVCYIKADDNREQGQQAVQDVIDYFNTNLRSRDHDEEIFRSLFICCDFNMCYEDETPAFRKFINDCLGPTPCTWTGENRIIFGTDHALVGGKVSQHLEDTILDVFMLMYEYLDRFVYRRTSSYEIGNVALEAEVQKTLYNFVRNVASLADTKTCELPSRKGETVSEADVLDDIFLDALAQRLKCVIVYPLARKMGMKLVMCSICLEEINVIKILKKHFSKTTRSQIRKLNEYSQQYIMEAMHTKQDAKERPTHSRFNDYMVHGMQNDLSSALCDIEIYLRKAVRQIGIMEKVQFEIEGYFKLGGIILGKPAVVLPEGMVRDLFALHGVIGVGTIYGKFEVHFKGDIKNVKPAVADVLKRHKFNGYFEIRKVEKEAMKIANIQHEHGSIIKSKFPGNQTFREGTLGIFSEEMSTNNQGPKKLFALTCAHVVSPLEQPEHNVYVIGRLGRLRKLGVSTPQMTVDIGANINASLIDIAAVKIESDLQNHCVKQVKDEDGLPRTSYLTDMTMQQLEKQSVYKFGAKSSFTRGVICSMDYLLKFNSKMSADYLLLIETLPGQEIDFALPGDSGSVVCMPSVNSSRPVGSVELVAMVHAGNIKLEDFESNLCMAFLLSKGLELLKHKSGVQLSVGTHQSNNN